MFKLYRSLFTLLLLTFLCTSGRAQTAEIVFPTGVDQYENFASLYISPQGRGFAVGECGSLLRTINDGASFEALPAPNRVSQYTAVVCLPGTNCGTALLSTNRGIQRTTNFGANWTQVRNASFSNYNLSLDGTIFLFRRGFTALVITKDVGDTWTEVTLPDNLVSDIFPVSDTEWFFFGADKCYRSTNAGTSWQAVFTFPKDVILAHRDTDGNFYVALQGNDYYKSSDQGASWTLKTENGHQYGGHYDLFKDAQDSLHTISFNGVRFSSADDGANWTSVRTLPFQRYNSIFRSEGRLFAAGDALGLITADADASNIRRLVAENTPAFDNIQFADRQSGYAFESQFGGIYKTENGGESWALKNTIGGTTEGRMKVDNNKHIFANSGQAFSRTLVRSDDGGSTFREPLFVRQAGLSSNPLIFSPLPGGGLIAMSATGKTIITDGNTVTTEYSHSLNISGGSWDMTMLTDDFGFIHRTPREPVFRTIDGGQTWQESPPLGTGLFYTYIYFLDDNVGYIGGGNNNTYKTTDRGLTWERETAIRNSYGMFKIEESLFVVGRNQLFRSIDDGAFWDVVDDFGCSGITNATSHPGTDDIYVTFDGAIGRVDPREILSPVTEISPLSSSLRAVPNPSSGIFQLELPVSGTRFTELSVFDVTGRRVLSRELRGNRLPEINLLGQPAGVYLARVRTDQGRILTTRVVKR